MTKEESREPLKHVESSGLGDEPRAFCPTCGPLEIKDGKTIHPRLDMIYAKMLMTAANTTNYTSS
jgi:hypothetical protein